MAKHTFAHRNGETIPPEVGADEFTAYWFFGKAEYENWEHHGNMIVVTGESSEVVWGLVHVTLGLDPKKMRLDKDYTRSRPVMLPELEHGGFDLDKCRGRWYGPVPVPAKYYEAWYDDEYAGDAKPEAGA